RLRRGRRRSGARRDSRQGRQSARPGCAARPCPETLWKNPLRMRFGIFLAPFHPVGQSPTAALQRDLEMIQRLDDLGYDEAWIGEHHSAGYEIIASPEVFIAVAAERTRRIRFGTGVSSLPYHPPLMLA